MPVATNTVLVTGATGFLGAALVKRFVSDGADVHVLLRSGSEPARIAGVLNRVKIWYGDVTNFESVLACVQGTRPDTIFHLAGDTSGRRPTESWEMIERALSVNFNGVLNLLRAAEITDGPLRTLIRTGGLAEYGMGQTPSREDQREQPLTPYAASQTAATHWCQTLQQRLGFSVVTLRLGLTYGPGQASDFFIPALIDSLLRHKPFAVASGGQGRDFVYVDDVIDALSAAPARSEQLRGEVVNIASGQNVLLKDVALTASDLLGGESSLHVGDATGNEGEIERMSGDTVKAERLLGWRASTSLREGLQRTIDARRACFLKEK
jgi:nucleoside-diphosphate-sugar epimerase